MYWLSVSSSEGEYCSALAACIKELEAATSSIARTLLFLDDLNADLALEMFAVCITWTSNKCVIQNDQARIRNRSVG